MLLKSVVLSQVSEALLMYRTSWDRFFQVKKRKLQMITQPEIDRANDSTELQREIFNNTNDIVKKSLDQINAQFPNLQHLLGGNFNRVVTLNNIVKHQH